MRRFQVGHILICLILLGFMLLWTGAFHYAHAAPPNDIWVDNQGTFGLAWGSYEELQVGVQVSTTTLRIRNDLGIALQITRQKPGEPLKISRIAEEAISPSQFINSIYGSLGIIPGKTELVYDATFASPDEDVTVILRPSATSGIVTILDIVLNMLGASDVGGRIQMVTDIYKTLETADEFIALFEDLQKLLATDTSTLERSFLFGKIFAKDIPDLLLSAEFGEMLTKFGLQAIKNFNLLKDIVSNLEIIVDNLLYLWQTKDAPGGDLVIRFNVDGFGAPQPKPPVPPQLLTPPDDAWFQSGTNPNLTWSRADNDDSTTYQCVLSGKTGTTKTDFRGTTSFTPEKLSSGTYSLRVIAKNLSGEASSEELQFHLNAPPLPPLLITPEERRQTQNFTVRFELKDQGDADNFPNPSRQYWVEVWKEESLKRFSGWLSTPVHSMTFSEVGTYFWRARSSDGWEASAFTPTRRFTISEPVRYATELFAQNPKRDEVIKLLPGEVREVEVDYKNRGNTIWENTGGVLNPNSIELRAVSENGTELKEVSRLWRNEEPGRWINGIRVGSFLEAQRGVAPGQVARFVFTIQASSALPPGEYAFSFRPYHTIGGFLDDWGEMRFKVQIVESKTLPDYAYQYTTQNPQDWRTLSLNDVIEVEIDYKNVGSTTWENRGGVNNPNYIELRAVSENGSPIESPLYHDSWINRMRVGSYLSIQKGVLPGQVARFVFKIRANLEFFTEGEAKRVYFRPYHAQGEWMPQSDWQQVHLKIRVGSDKLGANLFQINGKVLNADGSVGKNGLFVVVMNSSSHRRVAKDTTGNLAGDGKYSVTFFDPNLPVARADDVLEVTVIDTVGKLLAQKKQRLTAADIKAFGTSIDIKLQPTLTGQIRANLFSIHGTVYTALGTPVEDGFPVTVQNSSKPSLVTTTTTGAVAGDGGYIVTFFNLAEPVVAAGDVVEITVLDKAGNPFAQKKLTLTEANVKAFGVTIDLTQQTGIPPTETKFESPHFTIDYAITGKDMVYRPDLTTVVDGKVYPAYLVVLAEALEKAHTTYLQHGFKDPIGSGVPKLELGNEKMKVEIKGNLANDALGESHHEVLGIGKIVIDNDMNPEDGNDPKPTDELVFDTLRVTAAHELFHHVQERHVLDFTSIFISDFLKEGTAVWAEDLVFNDINYYIRRRINPTTPKIIPSFLENPDQPLFESSYNSILFWKHLTEHHVQAGQTEAQVILEVWKEANPGDTNPKNLIEKVTNKNFEAIFQNWLIANYALNLPRLNREKYIEYTYRESQDGVGYGQLQIPAGHKVQLSPERPSHEWGEQVNRWAADYFVIHLGPSRKDVTIDFDGAEKSGLLDTNPSDNFIEVQILLVKEDDLYKSPVSVHLNAKNDGRYRISVGDAHQIVIIVGGADDGGNYTLRVKEEEGVRSPPSNVNRSDVNADGVVNVFDLVIVSSQFGQKGDNLSGDVNGDGVVNVLDVVIVASHFGEQAVAQAPRAELAGQSQAGFSKTQPVVAAQTNPPSIERLRRALAELEAMSNPSRGVEIAGQMLRAWLADFASIVTETKLLPNYPNPFNPEVWIPYKLAADSPVVIHIYNLRGQLVRSLDLGEKPAGVYVQRRKAAYWDGRNTAGERVASGVYIYHLQAGEFSAVRKMILMK